ncbi:hypothetical protein TNCV_931441 [Trichonephila clavipes]|uniref:Uncharacterized protein n=1 Tax=Trichonephila clavipes TaxID=2585209 RepID=A0A8X7BD21_TRICX|nr:hypothetical protein TNCV_931441 [Trichonephila clavipes]
MTLGERHVVVRDSSNDYVTYVLSCRLTSVVLHLKLVNEVFNYGINESYKKKWLPSQFAHVRRRSGTLTLHFWTLHRTHLSNRILTSVALWLFASVWGETQILRVHPPSGFLRWYVSLTVFCIHFEVSEKCILLYEPHSIHQHKLKSII